MDDAAAEAEPARRPDGLVTLVEGSSFCVSGRSGDISPGHPQGLFFRDTRIVSQWELQVDAGAPEVLTVVSHEPYRATFVARIPPAGVQTEVLVERRRFIGDGMREDLVVRNLGSAPVTAVLRLCVGADFADLFDVKESRARPNPARDASRRPAACSGPSWRTAPAAAASASPPTARGRGTTAWSSPSASARGTAGARASSCSRASTGTRSPAASRPTGRGRSRRRPGGSAPGARAARSCARRLGARRHAPAEHGGPRRAADHRPAAPRVRRRGRGRAVVHGAVRPRLAADVVHGAAARPRRSRWARCRRWPALQGTKVDPRTEEQPGRILHETAARPGLPALARRRQRLLRHGRRHAAVRHAARRAAPVGHRRRARRRAAARTLDRALEWIDGYGDRDGDGFVEYERTTPSRAWRTRAGRTPATASRSPTAGSPEPPIALCEVQGYVYAAFVARAALRRARRGDADAARPLAPSARRR